MKRPMTLYHHLLCVFRGWSTSYVKSSFSVGYLSSLSLRSSNLNYSLRYSLYVSLVGWHLLYPVLPKNRYHRVLDGGFYSHSVGAWTLSPGSVSLIPSVSSTHSDHRRLGLFVGHTGIGSLAPTLDLTRTPSVTYLVCPGTSSGLFLSRLSRDEHPFTTRVLFVSRFT